MTDQKNVQLAVIGGGPGGYSAAFMAADLGLKVALIDVEENPGGVCLYRGCIPSKALLHVAKVINEAREAAHWGLKFKEPEIDLDRVRESTQEVIRQMTGGLGQLCKARNVEYIRGLATYSDSQTLNIVKQDGHAIKLKCEKSILAAGSRPTRFGPLVDSPRLMNSTDALKLEEIPKSLLIIGGGYIGLELGSVYSTLGSKVTVVEMTDGLLPGADRDLVKPLQDIMETRFHQILLNTKVTDMKELKSGVKVTMEGPEVKKPSATFEKVLVSVGRKPNSSGLGLENTSITRNDQGFVEVDEQMRTQDQHIFAIGDIVGGFMLAHKATHEGRVAAEVIAGHNVAFEPLAIPAVVFTDPELAWCGLTETQAREQERAVSVTRFPWAASGRAATLNRSEGLTKLITDPDSNQILGMGIVGNGAGELIAEGALAIEMGAVAKDLDLTIHPHPTLSETLMESAGALFGQSTHIYRPRKKDA